MTLIGAQAYHSHEIVRSRVPRKPLELRDPFFHRDDGKAATELLADTTEDDFPVGRARMNDVDQGGEIFLCQNPVDIGLAYSVQGDPSDRLHAGQQGIQIRGREPDLRRSWQGDSRGRRWT